MPCISCRKDPNNNHDSTFDHIPEGLALYNKKPVVLEGKPKYVFVDIFDKINFDLSKPQGVIVTKKNGLDAEYMEEIHDGDVIEVYWENK